MAASEGFPEIALFPAGKPGHSDLKCLFISGYTANVIAPHGVLDDGLQYLQKPLTVQGLTEKAIATLEQPPSAGGKPALR